MLQELIANPGAGMIQVFGSLLLCAIFLFLWRTSGVVHFGFWSLAFALASLSAVASLLPQALLITTIPDLGFALALLWAATHRAQRRRLLLAALVLAVYGVFWRRPDVRAILVAFLYAYTFYSIGLRGKHIQGIGRRLLRFSLAALAVQAVAHVLGDFPTAFDMLPQSLLACAAMIIWIETQHDTIHQLRADVVRLEHAANGATEIDHLTSLQNRKALDRFLELPFAGVVAVCDLDLFKEINDRFGHLVGDEVLRGVGHLIRASIRAEDEAFRWGGDEFVIVFRHQNLELARGRMRVLEDRLRLFRVRGHGQYPLGLSWGAAEGEDRILRTVLEEADLQMYERKRQTHAKNT